MAASEVVLMRMRSHPVAVVAQKAVVAVIAAARLPWATWLDCRVALSRLGAQAEVLVRETAVTVLAVRTIALHLAEALDDRLLERLEESVSELRVALPELLPAVPLLEAMVPVMQGMSEQIEQALPVVDATEPALNLLNGTLAQLNATVAQIDALPGVRMARRLVVRQASPSAFE